MTEKQLYITERILQLIELSNSGEVSTSDIQGIAESIAMEATN